MACHEGVSPIKAGDESEGNGFGVVFIESWLSAATFVWNPAFCPSSA